MNRHIYLDNNASTAVDPQVCKVLTEFLPKIQGNPSSTHSFGREAKSIVNHSRDVIARYLKAKPTEIVFTCGGTESALLAIQILLAGHEKGHIITSKTEHPCIYKQMMKLGKEGYDVTMLLPAKSGGISAAQVQESIRPDTKLIAIMSANNETGVKNEITEIAEIARKRNIPLLVDSVASLGKEEVTPLPGISAMTFSGHKIHVPAGIGFLYLSSSLQTKKARDAVGHEGGWRQGTENLLGIVALQKGIELMEASFAKDIVTMGALRDTFEATLTKALPNITINGSGPRVPNVSNVCFHGVDGESLLIALDRNGVAASHGSACTSGALETSRILLAMGLPIDDVRSSIRFSLSRMTTREEIAAACEIIISTIRKLTVA